MHGDERYGHAAAITQLDQRRVGMVEHILLQPLQQRAPEGRLASGIRRFRGSRAGVSIALEDILHCPLGHSETLGDLSHGLAVLQTRRHNSLTQIYGCWFHGYSLYIVAMNN